MDDQVYDPVETAPVPLFGGVVLAARSTDGLLWLAVQDLAIALEIDARSQRRRIQANPLLNRHTRWFRAGTSGGPQAQLFLRLGFKAAHPENMRRTDVRFTCTPESLACIDYGGGLWAVVGSF